MGLVYIYPEGVCTGLHLFFFGISAFLKHPILHASYQVPVEVSQHDQLQIDEISEWEIILDKQVELTASRHHPISEMQSNGGCRTGNFLTFPPSCWQATMIPDTPGITVAPEKKVV